MSPSSMTNIMGWPLHSIILEGFMSAFYHICPTNANSNLVRDTILLRYLCICLIFISLVLAILPVGFCPYITFEMFSK